MELLLRIQSEMEQDVLSIMKTGTDRQRQNHWCSALKWSIITRVWFV